MTSVMWPPLRVAAADVVIRVATEADVPILEEWDRDPNVIACTTDDPDAVQAFPGADWHEEIGMNSDLTCYYIAEHAGRPIGGMQVIDPQLEPTHYWGEIEPHLRAIDIWIGDPADRNKGLGDAMMSAVIDRCFSDGAAAIVIDPLNSNADAQRFYQRLGFKVLGRQMFGEDDCLVHRLDRSNWEQRHGS